MHFLIFWRESAPPPPRSHLPPLPTTYLKWIPKWGPPPPSPRPHHRRRRNFLKSHPSDPPITRLMTLMTFRPKTTKTMDSIMIKSMETSRWSKPALSRRISNAKLWSRQAPHSSNRCCYYYYCFQEFYCACLHLNPRSFMLCLVPKKMREYEMKPKFWVLWFGNKGKGKKNKKEEEVFVKFSVI